MLCCMKKYFLKKLKRKQTPPCLHSIIKWNYFAPLRKILHSSSFKKKKKCLWSAACIWIDASTVIPSSTESTTFMELIIGLSPSEPERHLYSLGRRSSLHQVKQLKNILKDESVTKGTVHLENSCIPNHAGEQRIWVRNLPSKNNLLAWFLEQV